MSIIITRKPECARAGCLSNRQFDIPCLDFLSYCRNRKAVTLGARTAADCLRLQGARILPRTQNGTRGLQV